MQKKNTKLEIISLDLFLCSLIYADDTVLLTTNQGELQAAVE